MLFRLSKQRQWIIITGRRDDWSLVERSTGIFLCIYILCYMNDFGRRNRKYFTGYVVIIDDR